MEAISGNTMSENIPLIQCKTSYQRIKARIIKDLVVLTAGFLFNFSAYTALQNLESSLNREGGLGLASLSCIYGGIVLSCLLSPLLIGLVGEKWTVALGFLANLIFISTNFYPRMYTLVPSSILLGLASGPLWTAQGTYVTKLSSHYAALDRLETHTHTLSRFNGFFYTFQQSSNIWGNLVASAVLYQNDNITTSNETTAINGTVCGPSFCQQAATTGHHVQPDSVTINVLLSAYLGCVVIALVLIVIFLRTPEVGNGKQIHEDKSIRPFLRSTITAMKEQAILMMIPLFLFTGVEQAMLVGTFPLAFVSCDFGIVSVGYIMAVMGICSMVAALGAGCLEKWSGQLPLLLSAGLLNAALMVIMLCWYSISQRQSVVYVIAGLWGVVDGIYQSQTGTLVGTLFPDTPEAGFANWVLFKCAAQSAVFVYSQFLCVNVQIYIALAVLCLAKTLLILLYLKSGFRKQK